MRSSEVDGVEGVSRFPEFQSSLGKIQWVMAYVTMLIPIG